MTTREGGTVYPNQARPEWITTIEAKSDPPKNDLPKLRWWQRFSFLHPQDQREEDSE